MPRVSEAPTDIVGHKTFATGETGPDGFPVMRHEPLTRAEADAMLADVDKAKAKRAADMPDEKAAINALGEAFQRLRELGWREAMYCPKDGSTFDAIEAGSTGIHACHYQGEWPDGCWWVEDAGDLWPARPILFRVRAALAGGKE